MMQHMNATIFVTIALMASCAAAEVVEYNTDDRDQWFDDVGGPDNVSTVDFTGFPDGMPVDDQWAHLGVHFGDLTFISGKSTTFYPNDGWGAIGYPDINITFDQPMQWIAADFPGAKKIQLFDENTLIYESSILGGVGNPHFGGIVSDESFDRVRFFLEDTTVQAIDDLFFGPPIPAPASLAPLAVLLCARSRRRDSFIACN